MYDSLFFLSEFSRYVKNRYKHLLTLTDLFGNLINKHAYLSR